MKGLRMEELTEDEFESLSDEEKSKYLEQILGPFEDFGYSSDFDDEDLFSIVSGEDRVSGDASDSDDSGISTSMQDGNSNESSMDLDKENQIVEDFGDDSPINFHGTANLSINEEAVNYTDIVEDLYNIIGNLVDSDQSMGSDEVVDGNSEISRPALTTINLKDIEWQCAESPTKPQERLSASDAFKKIFTCEIVDTIIRCTNERARSEYNEYNKACAKTKRKQLFWRDLTRQEFYSFLGILIAAGANNANTDSSVDMWKITSYPLYRAAMSLNRFWNTLRFMRFAEPKSRVRGDRLASIRQIWSLMNANLAAARPRTGKNNNLSVHDQLFPFKGINGFSQYNPSKPAKYGIKIWWVCDAASYYPVYGEIDTGPQQNRNSITATTRLQQQQRSNENQRHHHRTSAFNQKASDSSKRITPVGIPGESFFTTLSAAKACVAQSIGLRRRSVLKESNEQSSAAQKSGKINANVVDKLLRRFTTHRRTVKWSTALFFNLLDVATFASYVIYHEENGLAKNSSTQRKSFMRQLSEELCLPVIEERARDHQALKNLSTRLAIECMLGKSVLELAKSATEIKEEPRAPGPKPVVGCCFYCFQAEDKRRRKTRQSCHDCTRPVCSGHSKNFVKCYKCK